MDTDRLFAELDASVLSDARAARDSVLSAPAQPVIALVPDQAPVADPDIPVEVVVPARRPSAGTGKVNTLINVIWTVAEFVWSIFVGIFKGLKYLATNWGIRSCYGHRSRFVCCCCRDGQSDSGHWDHDLLAALMWLGVAALGVWYWVDLSHRRVEIPWSSYYIWDPIGRVFSVAITETTSVWMGKPIYTTCVTTFLVGLFNGLVFGAARSADADKRLRTMLDWFTVALGGGGVVGGAANFYRQQAHEVLDFVVGALFTCGLLVGINTGRFWRFMCCCQPIPARVRQAPIGVEAAQHPEEVTGTDTQVVLYRDDAKDSAFVDGVIDTARARVSDADKAEVAFSVLASTFEAIGKAAGEINEALAREPVRRDFPAPEGRRRGILRGAAAAASALNGMSRRVTRSSGKRARFGEDVAAPSPHLYPAEDNDA